MLDTMQHTYGLVTSYESITGVGHVMHASVMLHDGFYLRIVRQCVASSGQGVRHAGMPNLEHEPTPVQKL